jgi:hypothetical protein
MRLVIKPKKDNPEIQYVGTPPQSAIGGAISGAGYRTRNTAGLEDESSTEAINECGCPCAACSAGEHPDYPEEITNIPQDMLAGLFGDPEVIYVLVGEEALFEGKKKGDRCVRIAKRKYHKWPSAYASGAVVKCRQGKIWKGLKESTEHVEYEVYEATLEEATALLEKYKKVQQGSLHDWFSQNRGKGWIDCRTGKPCGREKAGRGAKRKYPACRPTKAHCNKAGTRRKKGKATVSWKPKKEQ